MNLVGPGIVVHIFIIYIYKYIYTHSTYIWAALLLLAVGCGVLRESSKVYWFGWLLPHV